MHGTINLRFPQLFMKLAALCGSLVHNCAHNSPPRAPSRSKLIQSTINHFKTHFMEVFVLLELKAAYVNSCLPTFQDSLSVSSSRIKRSACSILDDGTNILSRNVCKQLPSSTAQHPTWSKTSTRPQRKLTNLYPCCYYVSLQPWHSFSFFLRILHAFLFSPHAIIAHAPPFSSPMIRVA